jgi:hypothetical protein
MSLCGCHIDLHPKFTQLALRQRVLNLERRVLRARSAHVTHCAGDQNAAPIGAAMFKMERLNHSRTKVYGDACALLPVDTFSPADRLKKVKNGLKFERFGVFFDFDGSLSTRPARCGERQRSLVGPARFSRAQGNLAGFQIPLYLPGTPNESPRLVGLLRLSTSPGCAGGAGSRPAGGSVSTVSRRKAVPQAGLFDFGRWESDAAQALQTDSRTCRGVQDGSITGWEDCSYSQDIAVRQWDEEMAQ